MKDYYKILGVPEQATDGEIKAAYRKLVKAYHPDVVRDDKEKEAQMYEIQEAYQCLGETQKRKAYDEKRKNSHAAANTGKPQKNGFPNSGRREPDMNRFEAFFGFQPGKGMETYHDKRGYARETEGPIRPEEMFASFFGGTGQRGGKRRG
ncbi:J domain-containing protein [Clostridiaceae bacterium]|nr:J domain-containing protein [Clostridiaceae bacterium]